MNFEITVFILEGLKKKKKKISVGTATAHWSLAEVLSTFWCHC